MILLTVLNQFQEKMSGTANSANSANASFDLDCGEEIDKELEEIIR